MTTLCGKLLASLGDFIDGELEESLCADIEAHMKGCDNCRLVVDNLRKTVTVFKAGKTVELPDDIRTRLHKAMAERWKSK